MKAEDLEETTIYNYGITLDRVRGRLGNIRLQDLAEEHVEEWMDWAPAHGRVRGKRAGTPLSHECECEPRSAEGSAGESCCPAIGVRQCRCVRDHSSMELGVIGSMLRYFFR
ncbi:MAG: hypothetical protein JF597_47410 [Streptomyces sp.]|uniref:hypothetical protein n=1 Tax=Streptomyces sp. TaxID=1931 RepID=UPI0025F26639|nr:hypothetical protein [Streptomyces sp.]MBW8800916.1 hypothetical protein [Streptomyces sp.]